MSQNQSRNGKTIPPSKTVLDRKRLTLTETKYMDWNSNLKLRLNNLARDIERGQEGPAMLDSTSEIKSVFSIQPPLKVFPNSSTSNNGKWNYYRPVTVPANFAATSSSLKAENPAVVVPVLSASFVLKPKPFPNVLQSPRTNTALKNAKLNANGPSNIVITNQEIPDRPDSALNSCLKKAEKIKTPSSSPKLPVSDPMLKPPNVTFAPDTVIHQRENKPAKTRSPKKNRKPRFAHPCCGHFLPAEIEIIPWKGPSSIIDQNNPYTRFTAVWIHPSDRVSKETELKWMVRQKRFNILLSALSNVHRQYNTLSDARKGRYMLKEVLPRYIMGLDIALMDGDMLHTDRLLKTITTTLRVLLVTLHDEFFLEDGESKPVPILPLDGLGSGIGYLADLGPVIFALNRISGERPRQDCSFLSIETVLIKLQLEMFCLVICPVKSVMFRCIIGIIHETASRSLQLVTEIIENENPGYFIKWVNNSVLNRDYMRILKDFRMADENGSKSEIPSIVTPTNLLNCQLRPLTAPPYYKKAK